jgi:TonB family protein
MTVNAETTLGFGHFIAQSDAVGKTLLTVLILMSVLSWVIIALKGLTLVARRRRSHAFLNFFWNATSLDAVAPRIEAQAAFVVPEPPPEPAPPALPDPPMVVVVAAPAPPAPPPPPAAPRELPASAIQYLEPPEPVYPRASRRLGEAGLVVVRVFVGTDGLPKQLQVLQSSGFVRLDEAALDGVRRARFKPPTENGQPTAGWARIPIPFELEK